MTPKSLLKDAAIVLRGKTRLVRRRRVIERQSEVPANCPRTGRPEV